MLKEKKLVGTMSEIFSEETMSRNFLWGNVQTFSGRTMFKQLLLFRKDNVRKYSGGIMSGAFNGNNFQAGLDNVHLLYGF